MAGILPPCLACAEVGVTLERGEEGISLQSYLHAQKRAGFVKVSIPSDAYSVHLKNPDFGVKGEEYTDLPRMSLKHLKYDPPVFGEETGLRWYLQRVNAELSYALLVASRNTPSGSELCYTVASSLDGADWLKKAGETVRALLEEGYDANREAHREWWAGYWDKSAVRLPDPLYEKNWYLVNYLFGACSRKGCPPMPLQGVWTADNGEMPPWKGDYHHDLNTQMSYYHYLKANHLPEGESFLDYLWSLQPAARAFCKDFTALREPACPQVWRLTGHGVERLAVYSLAPTNQLWLCQLFERHYTYTGDEAFLRGRAYPYLKETAEFILCLLKEDDKGFLTLPVSSSPELHNDNLRPGSPPTATMTRPCCSIFSVSFPALHA